MEGQTRQMPIPWATEWRPACATGPRQSGKTCSLRVSSFALPGWLPYSSWTWRAFRDGSQLRSRSRTPWGDHKGRWGSGRLVSGADGEATPDLRQHVPAAHRSLRVEAGSKPLLDWSSPQSGHSSRSFIHSFTSHLWSTCHVPGVALDAGDSCCLGRWDLCPLSRTQPSSLA